jgi:hypothetical protein
MLHADGVPVDQDRRGVTFGRCVQPSVDQVLPGAIDLGVDQQDRLLPGELEELVEVLVGASDENEEILRKKIETLIKQ